MRIERLVLDKFLTFEELDYNFEKKSYLVQGINSTDDEQENNGSGKSSILAGIEFPIAASNSRGISDKELIKFGHDEGSASVYISCDIRKETLFIKRIVRLKGSGLLDISIQKYGTEEWVKQSFSNVRDGNNFVMTWIGISKEDLFNYFLINSERYKSFFSSSNKEKVDLINRFSDASIVDGLEDVDTTLLIADVNQMSRKIDGHNGRLDQLKEDLDREGKVDPKVAFNTLVEKKELEILDIKEEIEDSLDEQIDLAKELNEESAEVTDVKTQIAKAEKAVDDFVHTNFKEQRGAYNESVTSENSKLKLHKTAMKDVEEKQDKIKHLLQHVNLQLAGAIECPSCKHSFILDSDVDVLKLKEKKVGAIKLGSTVDLMATVEEVRGKDIKVAIRKVEELISKINKKEKDENTLFNDINAILRNIQTKLTRAERRVTNVENSMTACKTSQIRLKSKVEVLEAELAALKPSNNLDRLKAIKEDSAHYRTLVKELEAQLILINDEIYKRNQWKVRFKQFRMFLANKSIEMIEYQTNRFLGLMESDINIKIEGFKTKRDGTIKEEITATVIRNNRERKFAGYSGGERARLQFSSVLANRYMINSTHPYGGLDSLFIDEIFESSDQLGLKNIIRTSEDLGITVIIISHIQITDFTENVLTVEKINDCSILR